MRSILRSTAADWSSGPHPARVAALVVAIGVVATTGLAFSATADPDGRYAREEFTTSGRAPTPTVSSEVGTVDCSQNVGGACLPFPPDGSGAKGAWIQVQGRVVSNCCGIPLQICLDNDGDDVCGTGTSPTDDSCNDQIWATHTDAGGFINPIGPLPTGYKADCPGGSRHVGYVVIVCEATHAPAGPPGHEHAVVDGTLTAATELHSNGSAPSGDFCRAGTPGTVITETVPLGVPPVAVAGLLVGVALAWGRFLER